MMNLILGDSSVELLKLKESSIDSMVTDPPAGIGFMGKEWDHDKGGRDGWISWLASVMEEARVVLKPGAHGLVWALPRTSHWTAMALEKAGFEIRDCVYHVFGSGFPKSQSIENQIAKREGAKREGAKREGAKREGAKREGAGTQGNTFLLSKDYREYTETENSKKWFGWGTALKPAVECWWLVRKPISEKTVAENVLKYGTGAMNIENCRVGTGREKSQKQGNYTGGSQVPSRKEKQDNPVSLGRWPAHLIHDGSEEVMALFPNTKGSTGQFKRNDYDQGDGVTSFTRGDFVGRGDSGSAARFFYCAKPSKKERDEGLIGEKQEVVRQGLAGQKKNPSHRNFHPTVKPIALMSYLCKLITPPNGTILDPFMGSGSTGVAAVKSGFGFIGIEQSEEYYKIAEARIKHIQR